MNASWNLQYKKSRILNAVFLQFCCFILLFFPQLMATGKEYFGTENEKLDKFDIFQFSKNVGEETSKRIDLELTPNKSMKIMKTRGKTHTRLIINNMNRNGMNCHAYLKCYQKTPVPRSRYIPNLKCYMNESAKALFLSDCEDNETFHAIRKTEKKKKKSKNTNKIIVRSRKGPNKSANKTVAVKKEVSNRAKSPSSIPLDPNFDNPILSSVLDDLVTKGEFNAEFEDLFCSTFTSSQTL